MRIKSLAIALLLTLASAASAFAQCTGNPAAGRICANVGATPTLPGWATMTSALDRNFGAPSGQGSILNRGASDWSATRTPILGLNGTAGGTLTLQGATSGSATISVAAAAGSTTFRLPVGNGSLNQVLVTDGSGNTSWTTAGAGTVSSVGLSMPSIFSVSGSPVTGTGTLTATLANQSANTVFAGPTSGGAAAPTFRALVGADLPNPAASTLGGVQSFAAVSSQWIRQISTSGVVTASQPAFSDISGTMAPGQCPNPSASTIGCVQSLAAVTSRWINTISTSGVPTATQPAFTDISGSATLAQLPSIGNNSILGNVSGGSAAPAAITATNILDILGSTQGQVLYRNASAWVPLSPGTNGQVLTSAGAGANPSWTTVGGTGTVTNIATGTGLTGGPVTTTGTIEFATIAAARVLANVTGGAAAPTANTMTSILDATLGSTQGNILYRGASNWTVLAPGTNGQVLTQGASTPSWASAGSVTNVTVAAGTGIGVSGTCNITTTGTCTVALSSARQTLPTHQTFTSGSGTYTTPANALYIRVRMVGGGGGGGGSGSSGAGDGGTGGSTTFSTFTATGGVGGSGGNAGTNNGVAGGTASGCTINLAGATSSGSQASGATNTVGGAGGGSAFFGGGAGSFAAAAANTGGGGSGGAMAGGSAGASGGGGGGSCEGWITSPAGSYSYAVGAGGTLGTAGTAGNSGVAGAAGYIVVDEYYN